MSVVQLVQEAKEYDVLKKVSLDNGFYTEIYTHFSNVRIDDALEDYSSFIAEYSKHHPMKERKMIDYINLHILLWFTTLADSQDYSYEDKIQLFELILKSKYAEQIFQAFDSDDIQNFYQRIFKKLEAIQELAASNEEVRAQFIESVKSLNIENKEEIMNVFFKSDPDLNKSK
ncbi:hypothetical protein DX130_04470 [Paenibacillus paeoniae]|uniref:Uncharacterized protein n=2 Tax=Paenibacillus paeoniae TaxID=2292705 RepID=A0A371PJB9_9BACL|nr:hypothetical protein DX130_04470 [Paenibacillus paeoniae]